MGHHLMKHMQSGHILQTLRGYFELPVVKQKVAEQEMPELLIILEGIECFSTPTDMQK